MNYENKIYMYGVSNNPNYKGIVIHYGRKIISFYWLKKLKFKIRKYKGESYIIFEEQFYTGNFFGLQLNRKVRFKPKN